MKVLKIVVGLLALLFAFSHGYELIGQVAGGRTNLATTYDAGHLGGHIFGICLGLAIAFACFRRKPAG